MKLYTFVIYNRYSLSANLEPLSSKMDLITTHGDSRSKHNIFVEHLLPIYTGSLPDIPYKPSPTHIYRHDSVFLFRHNSSREEEDVIHDVVIGSSPIVTDVDEAAFSSNLVTNETTSLKFGQYWRDVTSLLNHS